ncbi:extracellular solute-binding protein, family 5 middle family protein 16 [Pandoraea terrae]|uniref:Extracellular solute-binding protein, family 5 middle family protein 16 n=1 Tax=Pandoraea terrae TaxID=1537710 RepID=A0A5E4W0C7_9BURK|nr:ABC transporter substrate-binding protein [Pandoraea terrae]VVE17004.1 extracellular solute-binding protein, family 5 middle family protein 16 [Pandoraea terrae]
MLASLSRVIYRFCMIALAASCTAVALPAAAQTPQRGGTLNILSISAINTLNPAIQSGVATAMPGSQLFASLLESDADWKPHPYLADSWEVSKDGLAYTFHLNKNAVFHDGKPITSADVAFSLETVKQNHPFGPAMFASVARVETPDPLTAVFRLSKPNPALLLAVSTPALLPIIPKHIYDNGPIRSNPRNNSPVGSGPFKFVEYKPGEYLVLERFDKFFRPGRPYLDRITYTIMKDPSAMTLAVSRGDIQYVAYGPMRLSDVDRLAKQSNLMVTNKGYEGVGTLTWLAFNVRNKPLSDVRVRQAISYAIDRKFITEKLQLGRSKPAYGPIVASSPFYNPSLNHYDLNLDRANQLLDAAGFPKNAQGVRFPLRLDYIPANIDSSQVIAEYLKPQLKKIGVEVQLRPSPDFPTWSQRVSNGDFDMTTDIVFNWGDPVIGVARTYMSSNIKKGVIWSNTQGYVNPKVDQLLGEAAVENDAAKRHALYNDFQKIVNEELPVAYLLQVPYQTIYSKSLKNVPLGVWGAFAPFDDVYWAKAPG